MTPAQAVIFDLILTAVANGLAESLKVSDILRAAHDQGHQFGPEELAPFVIDAKSSLEALHQVNLKRKG